MRGRQALDLFCGCGGVAAAFRRRGVQCCEYDLKRGPQFDLTSDKVARGIENRIQKGEVVACMLAPPCSSFSIATDRVAVVRTRRHPWGVPNMSAADHARVLLGNKCAKAAIRIIRKLDEHHVPWILEQPLSSNMWRLPFFQRVQHKSHLSFLRVHQCQYGRRWKKATGLLCSRVDEFDAQRVSKTCQGRNGICSRTNLSHIQLLGGRMTKLAEPYPKALCDHLAYVLLGDWRLKRTGVP